MEHEHIDLIGEGSYGRVYYKEHDNVVIKEFKPGNIAIFIRELAIGIYLSKWPFFSNVSGFNIEKYQIIMEPWACDLRSIVTSGRGTREERISILRDVVKAIHVMHSLGMTHADIKTSNILVREVDGNIQGSLIDFGLSSLTQYANVNSTTPIFREPITSKSRSHDIYSLGIVCLELFADIVLVRSPKYLSSTAMADRIKDPVLSKIVKSMLVSDRSQRVTSSELIELLCEGKVPKINLRCKCNDKAVLYNTSAIPEIAITKGIPNFKKIGVCMASFDHEQDQDLEVIDASMIISSSLYNGMFKYSPKWTSKIIELIGEMLISDFVDCLLCSDGNPKSPSISRRVSVSYPS